MNSYRTEVFKQKICSTTGLLGGDKTSLYMEALERKYFNAIKTPKFKNCWLKVESYLRNEEIFYLVEYACGRLYFHCKGYTTNSLIRIMTNDLRTPWARHDYRKDPRIGAISLLLETEA